MIKVASFDGSLMCMNQKTIENQIRYCLHLAKLGVGSVSPNPPVGATLVLDTKIIGEGYHNKFGEAHAEVNAIASVADNQRHLIKDCCLFVSLEPCNHEGKTPPCTHFILKHQIKKIVFGCYDPNPAMSGKSIEFLNQHGVETIGPVLEKDCKHMIREFAINMTQNRPYIILKFAQSMNFMIGVANQKTKISNSTSDILVHKWRSQVDGILVGAKTILVDNPELTTRLWHGKNPIRIALGNFMDEEKKTLDIFNEKAITWNFPNKSLENANEIKNFLKELYHKNIGILMIEGGAKTLDLFYKADFWDEARIITNTTLKLQDGVLAPSIQGNLQNKMILDKDVIHYIANYQGD